MGKNQDEEPERPRCGACFGEGGNWEELNGEKGQERTWANCRACEGSGWVDA
ncbi:hypothetical protein GCM10009560_23280 [Nonomuraea longicatena]|jgi:hypothetical protein|uniref:Molecular chaperone DnaJ n=1 Tax=Nonomuraea longicatena TaxID=83682 RepID=A0ABP3ZNS1_9ACTN